MRTGRMINLQFEECKIDGKRCLIMGPIGDNDPYEPYEYWAVMLPDGFIESVHHLHIPGEIKDNYPDMPETFR